MYTISSIIAVTSFFDFDPLILVKYFLINIPSTVVWMDYIFLNKNMLSL